MAVEERSRNSSSAQRSALVGEDERKRRIVVVEVNENELSVRDEEGEETLGEHLKREMRMHKLLLGRGVVADVWPDASFVDRAIVAEESLGEEEDAAESSTGKAHTVLRRYCTESLDSWQPLSSVLRQFSIVIFM